MSRYTLSINSKHYPRITQWLDEQPNVSAAVRLLIQTHLNGGEAAPAAVDLSAIRTVFEAVLDERLNGISLNASPPAENETDQLSDFDDLLG